jgi:hypothetical protein
VRLDHLLSKEHFYRVLSGMRSEARM